MSDSTALAPEAIEECIDNNLTPQQSAITPGDRFKLCREVDRFPDFLAKAGLMGIVTQVDASGVWGRMDQHLPGCEPWDNQIHWETPETFAGDTEAA